MTGEGKPGRAWRFFALAVLVFGLIVYRGVLMPGQVLFTTDDNIGAIALRKDTLPHSFVGGWDDSIAAGQPMTVNITWTNLVLSILPVRVFVNYIHYLDLVIGSIFLGLFLRRKGAGVWAAGLAALTGCWLGSNFFLNYAGHIGKFGVVMFACMYLYLVETAVRRRSAAWAVLAGGAMGGMFLEQADSGLFFAMPLGLYALFRVVQEQGWKPAGLLRVVVPVAAVAMILAVRPVWTAYTLFKLDAPVAEENLSEREQERAEQELWEYCTQWSWPPSETIEWIAPGFFGWRSGEPAGPYWGKLGQSAQFNVTGQGFRNFKLETFYLGAIPIYFAAMVFFLGWIRNRKTIFTRGETIFWSLVILLTFLLGLGKYFPLYSVFFKLPGMSSIRNPVKFLQVTQVAIAILAGVGLQTLITFARDREKNRDMIADLKRWSKGGLIVAGLFGLWALFMSVSQNTAIVNFRQQGWGDAAPVMTANKIRAAWHAFIMLAIAWGGVVLLLRNAKDIASPWIIRMPAILIAVVALDQLVVSRHYVRTMPSEALVGSNEAITFIKQDLGPQRLLLLTQSGIYNQWLSILLPYHGIPTFNIGQMRMPEDYKQYFAAMNGTPQTAWSHFGVGLLAGPAGYWNQFQQNPSTKDMFEPAFAFNLVQKGEGVGVIPATQQQPGQHAILKPRTPWSRYRLASSWRIVPDGDVLSSLGPNEPGQPVVLSETAANTLGLETTSGGGDDGTLEVTSYRAGRITMKINVSRPAVLRAADKFSPHWTAEVDGKPAAVVRCDYLFLGVKVPPGIHEVTLTFAPPAGSLWLQFGGMALLAAAGLVLVASRRKNGDRAG